MYRIKPLVFLASTLFSVALFAQEDDATALPLSVQDYFDADDLGCTLVAGSLGATASGVPACSGADGNDVWYSFTSNTQAVVLQVNSNDADLVIELLDNSLISLGCVNAVAGTGEEEIVVNTLTSGDDYFLRIHSASGAGGGNFTICARDLPAVAIPDGWWPTKTVDPGLPGYKINELVTRNFLPVNTLVESTLWEFTDTGTGTIYSTTVNGFNSLLNLNSVGGLCFGTSYDVRVQIEIDGYMSGWGVTRTIMMEAVPNTEVEPSFIGQSYALDGELKAVFVGSNQSLEWRLTTDNGNTSFVHNGGSSSWLYLDDITCVRYNKIYNIEVRASLCGVWGPWSDPVFIITNPLPYTNVQATFCNSSQFLGGFVQCEFVPVADQYAWQFAPIDPMDPTMTPIGPAIVAYSPNTILGLNGLGLQMGETYRVAAKPQVGTFDACDDPQEGDYGFFCPVTIIDISPLAPVPGNPMELSMESSDEHPDASTFFPNPVSNDVLTVRLPSEKYTEMLMVDVLNLTGQLVYSHTFTAAEDAGYVQINLSQLDTGVYLVRLNDGSQQEQQRIIIQ